MRMNSENTTLRLRQAIIHNDLALVQRILISNSTLLRNPVYDEKADTSLHLAASLGFIEIVVGVISFLVGD